MDKWTKPNNTDMDQKVGVSSSSANDKKKACPQRKRWTPKLKPSELTHFTWLDQKKTFPFCYICQTKLSGGKFHLKRHEICPSHVRKMKAAKTTSLTQYVYQDNNNNNNRYLVKKAELKFAAYVCEHNLAFQLMDTFPLLLKDVFFDSEICNALNLNRKKIAQLTVGVLAPYIQNLIVQDLRNTYFCIMIDETTDITCKKSLIIIVRYWKDGRISDRILDLCEVESGTSQSIFDIIKKLLDENKIGYNNVIGFASDGASTMTGNIGGVQAKLKEIIPNIYTQICICHSLHLCASAAVRKVPDNIEQFVRDIYSYFAHSNKRLQELKECQVFANEKPHRMLYPSQTRWLSLKAVVDRILEHWNSLTLYFQRAALEDNLPNAKAILNALKNPIYKFYLLSLSYILTITNKINVELQAEGPKTPIVLERISSFYKLILRNYIKPNLMNVNIITINITNPQNYVSLDDLYVGARAEASLSQELAKNTVTPQEVENFKKHMLLLYIEFSKQILKRFDLEDKYLIFARAFAPEIIKSKANNSIANFINLFPQVHIDIEEANLEWQMLIRLDNLEKLNNDIAKFWNEVSQMKNSLNEFLFPNLNKIVSVILTLPHSSAAAERGFSQLNLNKTKIRNKLNIETCAAILIVKDFLKSIDGGSIKWVLPTNILKYNNIDNIVTNM